MANIMELTPPVALGDAAQLRQQPPPAGEHESRVGDATCDGEHRRVHGMPMNTLSPPPKLASTMASTHHAAASSMAPAASASVPSEVPEKPAFVDDPRQHREGGDRDGGSEEQRGLVNLGFFREQSGHVHQPREPASRRARTGLTSRRSTRSPRSSPGCGTARS